MSEAPSPDEPRRLLTELRQLVSDRAAVEKEVESGHVARNEKAEREYLETQRQLDERFDSEKAEAEEEYAVTRDRTTGDFELQHKALEKEYETARAKVVARFTSDQQAAQQALQDAHWEAMETADAARGGLNLPLAELLEGLDARWQELDAIHKKAAALLVDRGHWDEVPAATPTQVILEKHPGRRFCHALEKSKAQYAALSSLWLPRLFLGLRPWGMLLLLWVVTAAPSIGVFGWEDWRWAAVSAGLTALVAVIAGTWIAYVAKRQSIAAYLDLRQTMLEAGLGNATVLETTKAECQRLDATIIARHKAESQEAEATHTAALKRIEQEKQTGLERIEGNYPKRLAELAAWRERTVDEIEKKYPPLLQRLEDNYRAKSERLRKQHAQTLQESRERFEREWADTARRWRSGMERFSGSAETIERLCRESFPDWCTDDWNRWTMPTAIPPIIPFGRCQIKLAEIPDGVPEDERLRPARLDFTLPVVLPYPRRSLLLLKTHDAGRGKAVEVMQNAMLRLLTAMPPGKVRFTIVDPVGLGDNFSAFMHLADHDEKLVASRIWTDTSHIEQRLADLTKHMENVIQVYLRKEFHSIEEYNAFAGEMAEPYRVLVVANFPANFSEAAVHRIKSIVASGARCGVFVMLSIDTKLPLPRNFQLADLESDALALHWADGRFIWQHPDFESLAVEVDPPPSAERFKDILGAVGTAAKDTGRVEVPFSCIVPAPEDWWTTDSRTGIDVPLGRAGAMKLQHLNLGGGTSQHVLISGKTGSGKSTLLHVLVTNLALRYSPDEVELYLVDFKKGVEFKTYARCGLPHARVVAIESEREFGFSVLQRLDAELRTRGDLFRKEGIQDLKGYRAAKPETRLPRILLIIDEFQELFVEDDRIAQEAALLLDRLVRQGRAFGIHVLLGSQTLGGAYTLARSTIGQMAVRIALQCSEADAHLILSEDNTAARLLTRPGEAIYNDANGLYEGNHPFQVVWLADSDRDDYLRRIGELAQQKHCTVAPPIVFEGNVLADPADNVKLKELLAARTWSDRAPTTQAWLGSAVAIKDPTAAQFVRQNGSNLLMVGHREEAALGVMAVGFVSLASQHPPATNSDAASGARFYILDGMRSDAPEIGFWKRLGSVAPQAVKIGGMRDAAEIVGEIAAELAARQQEGHDDGPPVYLFLYNLGRFRDLKKEDDYGFSAGDDKPSTPAKQLAAILRDGAPLGIHCVIWCDTYSNVNRMLDRQSLRDFEMRVLFQMNANDSSSLMDTPEASRLGVHRAILYDEGQGQMEKFRPYGLPSPEWLASVKKRLQRKLDSAAS